MTEQLHTVSELAPELQPILGSRAQIFQHIASGYLIPDFTLKNGIILFRKDNLFSQAKALRRVLDKIVPTTDPRLIRQSVQALMEIERNKTGIPSKSLKQ